MALRIAAGFILGAVLVFPGTAIVKSLLETFRILPDASFSDAALVVVIILVCISLMRPWRGPQRMNDR